AIMMIAVTGGTAIVAGSSSASAPAGPMPGSTPMSVPSSAPAKQNARFCHSKATWKPRSRSTSISAEGHAEPVHEDEPRGERHERRVREGGDDAARTAGGVENEREEEDGGHEREVRDAQRESDHGSHRQQPAARIAHEGRLLVVGPAAPLAGARERSGKRERGEQDADDEGHQSALGRIDRTDS